MKSPERLTTDSTVIYLLGSRRCHDPGSIPARDKTVSGVTLNVGPNGVSGQGVLDPARRTRPVRLTLVSRDSPHTDTTTDLGSGPRRRERS